MKHHEHHQDFRDPVCGMEVSYKTAVEETVYDQQRYFFCSDVCKTEFELDPDKFIHHHRQHGMQPK